MSLYEGVLSSACAGSVGRMVMGSSHVMVSTGVGCRLLLSSACEPERLAMGEDWVSSWGETLLVRNSKRSCHRTVTAKNDNDNIHKILCGKSCPQVT